MEFLTLAAERVKMYNLLFVRYIERWMGYDKSLSEYSKGLYSDEQFVCHFVILKVYRYVYPSFFDLGMKLVSFYMPMFLKK